MGLRGRTIERVKTALTDLQENAALFKAIGEAAPSPGFVTAATLYVRHWVVTVRAVEVADLLKDHLYGGRNAVIFTSATLRQGESFEGFRRCAGIPAGEALEMGTRSGIMSPSPATSPSPMSQSPAISPSPAMSRSPDGQEQEQPRPRSFRFEAVPSPFDPGAAEISVPPEAVSGAFEGKEAWLDRVAALLPGLIRRNRGRTLVLFSSYGDLEAILARVSGEIQADGYPLLIQQAGSSTAGLCEEFRAIRESVLFGVDSFWYGVDFPGETLTQVIITRLPYPHPQDPLQAARRNLLSKEDYWRRYRYETAIKLRQGIGRLIRSEKDRGRVVILDSRYRSRTKGGAA
jgi:ATP-dependent DNA helicase DinG